MDYLNVRDDGTERITLRKNVKTRDYLFVTEALEEKGVREVVIALLVITLVVAISKWIAYRLSFMAVLLYYAECGQEIPDNSTIQKYQTKAALKLLGIREK